MLFSGQGFFGKLATRLAELSTPPYYGHSYLAKLNSRGYISPRATVHHRDLRLGPNIFLDDHVLIYQDHEGGPVELGARVHINRYCIIQTGKGGSLTIGEGTHVQPRCQFSAYRGSIRIGNIVQIAPNCAFYPYNHSFAADRPIGEQPLYTEGDIVIEDDAWLGVGVIVLDGVRIGKGAVIGAGSVVTHDIPAGAIAFGVPAKVVKMRGQ
jgi:acetyltransferase-like isoleucine patch superfamily enzyme